MKDSLLFFTFLLTGIYGYWIMDRVDRFLDGYVKGQGEETDEQLQR